jgi:hypothetical protein
MPSPIFYVLQQLTAQWIIDTKKEERRGANLRHPRENALAFCPGEFKVQRESEGQISYITALDSLCSFFKVSTYPSIMQLIHAVFDTDPEDLSNMRFVEYCEIVPVPSMGPGAKGVISTKPIAKGTILSLYHGIAVSTTCSNNRFSFNRYSVDISVLISRTRTRELVIVGSRDITGNAALYNDCRSACDIVDVPPADLAKVNVRLVHFTVCGYPLVVVMATKDIETDTPLLLNYGLTFWCDNESDAK